MSVSPVITIIFSMWVSEMPSFTVWQNTIKHLTSESLLDSVMHLKLKRKASVSEPVSVSTDLSDVCGGGGAVALWCDRLSAHQDAWIRVAIGINLQTHTETRDEDAGLNHKPSSEGGERVTSEDSYVMVLVSVWTTGTSLTGSSDCWFRNTEITLNTRLYKVHLHCKNTFISTWNTYRQLLILSDEGHLQQTQLLL